LAALSKENEKEYAGERRWFVTLSDALVRGHPFLGITHAFTLMTTNQWEGQGEDKGGPRGIKLSLEGDRRPDDDELFVRLMPLGPPPPTRCATR
jgi:hypothetical protein